MNTTEFVDGLRVFAPHEKAPDFVKANLQINRADLISWLSSKDKELIKLDVKVGKSGKWYVAVNNWEKPAQAATEARNHDANYTLTTDNAMTTDDIPF